jgi:hypothetical protein
MLPCANPTIGLKIKTSAVVSRSAAGVELPPAITPDRCLSWKDMLVRQLILGMFMAIVPPQGDGFSEGPVFPSEDILLAQWQEAS